MTDKSIKLAKIYVELAAMKDKIENELLPLMGYVNFPDTEIQNELQAVSNTIYRHFRAYEISLEEIKDEK